VLVACSFVRVLALGLIASVSQPPRTAENSVLVAVDGVVRISKIWIPGGWASPGIGVSRWSSMEAALNRMVSFPAIWSYDF
jgi:hypothetical protein